MRAAAVRLAGRCLQFALVLGALLGPVSAALAQTPTTLAPRPMRFYFFSPDWRPADLNTLTERVHVALRNEGLEVSFQGFARYEDFVRQVAELAPSFLLAPGWFQNTAASDLGLYLQPIATPLRHNRTTYRKALITRAGLNSIADLTRGSIAAAVHALGPGDEGAVLDSLHLNAGSTRVVPVPKDLDGLLALSFEQVDAALVTAQQFDLLAASNPETAAKLQVLAFSVPIPLPGVFAGPQTTTEDRRRMAAALAKFGDAEAGREVLTMLGYDSFEVLTPAQQEQPAAEQPADGPPAHRHAKNRKAK